jgi:hypothetical protein
MMIFVEEQRLKKLKWSRNFPTETPRCKRRLPFVKLVRRKLKLKSLLYRPMPIKGTIMR